MGIGDTDCQMGVLGGHIPHDPKEESKPLLPSIGAVTGEKLDHSLFIPPNKLSPIPMAPVPMLDGGGSLAGPIHLQIRNWGWWNLRGWTEERVNILLRWRASVS